MKDSSILAYSCDLHSPSREMLLFPAVPEDLSKGPQAAGGRGDWLHSYPWKLKPLPHLFVKQPQCLLK